VVVLGRPEGALRLTVANWWNEGVGGERTSLLQYDRARPQLKVRAGVDASRLVLAAAPPSEPVSSWSPREPRRRRSPARGCRLRSAANSSKAAASTAARPVAASSRVTAITVAAPSSRSRGELEIFHRRGVPTHTPRPNPGEIRRQDLIEALG
jgi:hypothetical protein